MSKFIDLSIKEIHDKLVSGEVTPTILVNECFSRIESNDYNSFITLDKEGALKRASLLESEGVKSNLLWGIPIAVKDNIMVKDLKCTCASHMLDNFISTYNASMVENLLNAGMIIIGKTNMDEFAMGSTSETSYYGAPIYPFNKNLVCGGSSGGSAVSVSAHLVPLSIGTDTGGSIRQPASFNNIVGMKPTYGRVSRFGMVAFASSLDQAGPMSVRVYDNALLLNELCSYDDKDMTSINTNEDFTRFIGDSVSGMKLCIPKYFLNDMVTDEVKNSILNIKKVLEDNGCIVDVVDVDYLDTATTLYQIIAMGEASSNLARFDGVRYGFRYPSDNLEEMYMKTREIGFGSEVKRRIMVGSFILSGENAKTYFEKALKLRNNVKNSFINVFKKYDLVIGPTCCRVSYPVNKENANNNLNNLDDILVMHANMGGFPSMNVPLSFNESGLPIGLQIMGNKMDEAIMYKLAAFIESVNGIKGGYNE